MKKTLCTVLFAKVSVSGRGPTLSNYCNPGQLDRLWEWYWLGSQRLVGLLLQQDFPDKLYDILLVILTSNSTRLWSFFSLASSLDGWPERKENVCGWLVQILKNRDAPPTSQPVMMSPGYWTLLLPRGQMKVFQQNGALFHRAIQGYHQFV